MVILTTDNGVRLMSLFVGPAQVYVGFSGAPNSGGVFARCEGAR